MFVREVQPKRKLSALTPKWFEHPHSLGECGKITEAGTIYTTTTVRLPTTDSMDQKRETALRTPKF
jgi:hypothetical protein